MYGIHGNMDTIRKSYDVLKVDVEHGIVFGFCLVSKVDGLPYVDVQDEHVTEDAMLKAAIDYADRSRVAGEMHKVEKRGEVLFNFPLTQEIADRLGIVTKQTGWIIGMRPDAEMLEGFTSGRLTGFSIGGWGSPNENGLASIRPTG